MKPVHAHLLILLAAGTAVFANTFGNGFHWDDHVRVLNNPGVTEFWPPWRHFFDQTTSANTTELVQYRPLLPLSLSISHALSGDSLAGYHFGNLLLHLLAAFGVYFVARELWMRTQQPDRAAVGPLLVALLFAVHPVSGITVNYITARDLPMMQAGMLASFACYLRMRRLGESPLRWAACLGLFLLALLAKKNAVALPALIVLFEVLFAKESPTSANTWRRAAPFVGVVLALLAFIKFGLEFSDFGNVVTEAKAGDYFAGQLQHHIFHYLPHFAWPLPIRLQPDWSHVDWQVVTGGLVVIGSWVLAWKLRERHPIVAFGILAYQVLLLLTSSVLPLIAEIVPYRPYPSSAFLWLAVGGLLLPIRHGKLVLGALVVWFGTCSFLMNGVWKDEVTLWTHSVDHGGNDRAYVALARLTTDKERRNALYRKAIELNPENGDAQTELAQSSGDLTTLHRSVAEFPGSAGSTGSATPRGWRTRTANKTLSSSSARRSNSTSGTWRRAGSPRRCWSRPIRTPQLCRSFGRSSTTRRSTARRS